MWNRKSVGVIALRVLGGLVAAVCLLVGLTLTMAKTRWGGERLRRIAVARVNEQIQGRLDIGRLSFGGDRVIVWDVRLSDPEGRFVASAARAEVDVALRGLLRHEIRLAAALDTPVVDVVGDPAGMNLGRALAARKPTPPRPPAPKTTADGWVVRLDRFAMTGATWNDMAVATRHGAAVLCIPTEKFRVLLDQDAHAATGMLRLVSERLRVARASGTRPIVSAREDGSPPN